MSADEEREIEERQREMCAEDNAREDAFDGLFYNRVIDGVWHRCITQEGIAEFRRMREDVADLRDTHLAASRAYMSDVLAHERTERRLRAALLLIAEGVHDESHDILTCAETAREALRG